MYNEIKPRLEEAKKSFPEFNHDITQYQTLDNFIDEVNSLFYNSPIGETLKKFERYYDYIWDGIIHEDAPPEIYDTYKDVDKGGAKANSEIVGELTNHIVVRSYSKEAAQYWEKGAIIIRSSGQPQFQTCTSRIYSPENFKNSNMFHSYSDYDMYQIIRKDALKDGKPVFYNEATNPPNHLITACVDRQSDLVFIMSHTVNAKDEDVTEEDFIKELGEDDFNKFKSIIDSQVTAVNFYPRTLKADTPEKRKELFQKVMQLTPYEIFSKGIFRMGIFEKMIEENGYNLKSFIFENLQQASPENFLNRFENKVMNPVSGYYDGFSGEWIEPNNEEYISYENHEKLLRKNILKIKNIDSFAKKFADKSGKYYRIHDLTKYIMMKTSPETFNYIFWRMIMNSDYSDFHRVLKEQNFTDEDIFSKFKETILDKKNLKRLESELKLYKSHPKLAKRPELINKLYENFKLRFKKAIEGMTFEQIDRYFSFKDTSSIINGLHSSLTWDELPEEFEEIFWEIYFHKEKEYKA